MLKRIDDIEIPADNPFANDLLDRKTIAENLATLLENTTTPYVMSISAPWGQGKTTFIRMWQQLLENRGFATAYFDAWSTDYANDPLLAFIGSIEASISANDSNATQALNGIKNALKKVIQASPKIALNWARRGGLHYLTDGDSSAKDEIDALSEIGAELVDKEMAQQLSVRKLLDEFSEKLSELGQTLGEDGKPLVILIDELDRCRPDYAIELLERIKHLFAVPNLLIVLSVDIENLGESASQVIGFSTKNATGYLRRFIDIDYRLPLSLASRIIDTKLREADLPEGFYS
ncbi:MAG: P-loop NTPase fold protein, partial [Planctomycetota bacterium]